MRAHAMRDSIRRKRLGTRDITPGKQLPYHTGRFRLSSSPTKGRGEPLEASTSSSNSDLDISKKPVEKAYDLAQRLYHDRHGLSTVPSRGRLDPFNTFLIMLGPRQQMLLSYYKTSFTQNALAFYSGPKPSFLRSSSDPAWLHATLAIIAVNYGFTFGVLNGVSPESLFHRGEALHLVRDHLSDPSGEISDNTIGAIASLANHEMMNGSISTCAVHMQALAQLLKLRGRSGVHKITKQSSYLRNLIAWSDLCYSGVTLKKPQYPPIYPIPQIYLDMSNTQAGEDNESSLPFYMDNMFQTIRLLSGIIDKECPSDDEKAYFSSNIFTIQYQLVKFNEKHSYFVRKLALVALRLRLSSFDSFINTLKETAWSKDFCTLHSTRLWNEMSSCLFEGLESMEDGI
ncbi:hypothetical protein V495_03785 [Pseudogymnoascus sp. VKM F-4514 (FW-929)]|nr:hypothetical protein V495_03785 [Pseudogymnoascus sp. VKM F-4514 (FW-929)]KFY54734.1 hypothetical protein V497_07512 [Pseudogymnoascus sp. VKM F-4516 (FW-969)]